jgi:hypothetical protein
MKKGKPMKRLLRFGLGKLLLFMAFISVAVGYSGKNYMEHRDEQQSLAMIQKKVLALSGRFELVSVENSESSQIVEFR